MAHATPLQMHPEDNDERTAYWDLWARYRAAPDGEGKLGLLRQAARIRQARVQRYSDFCIGRLLDAEQVMSEELVWFWFNHFNVFWQKDHIGMALPDYVETAIRPHVHGKFSDMLLATMTHPAMLMYLDNAQNFANSINENYARELLELHTLGVGGGYTQEDVQQVARVLTGLGVQNVPPPGSGSGADAPARDRFRFYAARHDGGSKQVLGHVIAPGGLDEARNLAELLAAHPSTAQHIARRLCTYFVADEPEAALVSSIASVFRASGGDLGQVTAAVAKAMADPRHRPGKFKDPLRYVVSSARLLADGGTFPSVQPVTRWLNALGQPLFRRSTPDGYPLLGSDWISPGQLTRRFDVAREMVVQLPRLLGKNTDALRTNVQLGNLERSLPEPLRAVLMQAPTPVDRYSLLLCSPNHMYG